MNCLTLLLPSAFTMPFHLSTFKYNRISNFVTNNGKNLIFYWLTTLLYHRSNAKFSASGARSSNSKISASNRTQTHTQLSEA